MIAARRAPTRRLHESDFDRVPSGGRKRTTGSRNKYWLSEMTALDKLRIRVNACGVEDVMVRLTHHENPRSVGDRG